VIIEASGTQTATPGTEHTLSSPSTAKTRALLVDVAALSGSETVTLKIKGAVLASGTVQVISTNTFPSGLADPHTQSVPVFMPQGGTFTLTQTGGTGRSYPWSIITLD
jgi:hypothetical protein